MPLSLEPIKRKLFPSIYAEAAAREASLKQLTEAVARQSATIDGDAGFLDREDRYAELRGAWRHQIASPKVAGVS